MTDFLTRSELASYLGEPESPALDSITTRTNALVTEEWINPVDPPPQWVVNIAWNVATRAGANRKNVTSTTRAWDDVTRTDRWEAGKAMGVVLEPDELAQLQGNPLGASGGQATKTESIGLRIPSWERQCRF